MTAKVFDSQTFKRDALALVIAAAEDDFDANYSILYPYLSEGGKVARTNLACLIDCLAQLVAVMAAEDPQCTDCMVTGMRAALANPANLNFPPHDHDDDE